MIMNLKRRCGKIENEQQGTLMRGILRMRALDFSVKIRVLAVAGVVAGAMSAAAQSTPTINLTLNQSGGDYTTASLINPDGTSLNNANLGVFSFTVNSIDPAIASQTGLTIGSGFNSVCLSPEGTLYFNQGYDYTYQSFSGAYDGINPSGYWSANGIQNAAYLWNQFGGKVTSPDQGTALSLAMLEVLYNGGAKYGTLNDSLTAYQPTLSSLDSTAAADYQGYLNFYTENGASSGPSGEAANTEAYGLFVPVDSTGQEFIFIAPNQESLQAVPEPTTWICGALLLLPFGASALRILYKKNKTS
jgi:hypothetical protein